MVNLKLTDEETRFIEAAIEFLGDSPGELEVVGDTGELRPSMVAIPALLAYIERQRREAYQNAIEPHSDITPRRFR